MSFPDLSTHNFECYKSYELAPSDLPKLLTIPPERPWSLELSFKGSPESVYPPIEGSLIKWLMMHHRLSALHKDIQTNFYCIQLISHSSPTGEGNTFKEQDLGELISILLNNILPYNNQGMFKCSISFYETKQEEENNFRKSVETFFNEDRLEGTMTEEDINNCCSGLKRQGYI